MARLKELIIEAENPHQLARFWADLLDEFEVRGYDESEIQRLADLGRTPETDPSVAVDGPGIVIFFDETTRPKTERGRIHLDLIGDSLDFEVARATRLGATVKAVRKGYTVLQDPEGNEFCIQETNAWQDAGERDDN
jgi:hypothetical protein